MCESAPKRADFFCLIQTSQRPADDGHAFFHLVLRDQQRRCKPYLIAMCRFGEQAIVFQLQAKRPCRILIGVIDNDRVEQTFAAYEGDIFGV